MSNSSVIRINAKLDWQVSGDRGGLVAVCAPINLCLEADDEAELRSLIGEALHYFFLTHFEENTLDAFLSRQGWTRAGHSVAATPGELPVSFEVPWEIVQHAP